MSDTTARGREPQAGRKDESKFAVNDSALPGEQCSIADKNAFYSRARRRRVKFVRTTINVDRRGPVRRWLDRWQRVL